MQIISHQAQARSNRELLHTDRSVTTLNLHNFEPHIRALQSWLTHLVEEQHQHQVELAEVSALEATEAETVDEEGVGDVVGPAVVETRAKRKNGSP